MDDPDRRLALRARGGDRDALAALYERHRQRLYGFLLKVARPWAEDVLQEVWIKVARAIDTFDPERGTFRAWLFGIAAREAAHVSRRELIRSGPSLDDPGGIALHDRVASDRPDSEAVAAGRELGRAFARAIETLSPAQRTAVLLRHQQGLSHAEIAQALGVPVATAKTHLHRGVLAVREALKEWLT